MISNYGIALIALSAFDLGLTLALISAGIAREGNPLMAYILREYGAIGMSAFKVVFTLATVILFEWYSCTRHTYLHYKLAIGLYVVLYIAFSLSLSLGG